MRMMRPNNPIARDRISVPSRKTGDQSRRHPLGPQQHHHRSSKVLTVPGPLFLQKRGDGMLDPVIQHDSGVGVVLSKIRLGSLKRVLDIGSLCSQGTTDLAHNRPQTLGQCQERACTRR